MKILVLESWNFPNSSLAKLQDYGEVFFDKIEESDRKQLLFEIEPDALFIGLGVEITKADLEKAKNLKTIITPTTGLNHIDLKECEERNIRVLSLKGEVDFLNSITSTAEHAWLLILSLLKDFRKDIFHVESGRWNRSEINTFELNGKTIGIIGFGRLGKILREYAKAFRMKCLIFDIDPLKAAQVSEEERSDLDHLLGSSDVISLMASYATENSKMIGEKEFGKMKSGVFFVNTARGELVDENALLDSLRSGKIAGAALDVLDNDSSWNERTPANHPLIEYSKKNNDLIITSHVGGNSKEALWKTREFVVNKFIMSLSS
ncbi:NAD(P)-dependent oxidoreductase [Leptospira yasudae]|uniref:NAD(P)-dependent oxidoreductase n=1 Tax=Leptospira yasudae TaxID=2202201 RepID=UPI001438531D|nr:NAD(P)-dependent oxidoreductase [Leptospira yasudae]